MASEDALALSDLVGHRKAILLERAMNDARLRSQNSGKSSGTRWLYVPQPEYMSKDHWIAQLIGLEDAMKLCKAFPKGTALCISGNINRIARQYRNESIIKMMNEGEKAEHVAYMHKVSKTRLYEIINDYYADR